MQDQIGLLQVHSPSSRHFIFVAHVKLYYNNSSYIIFSRNLKIVIILDHGTIIQTGMTCKRTPL